MSAPARTVAAWPIATSSLSQPKSTSSGPIDHEKRQVTIVPQEGENLTGPLGDDAFVALPDIAHSIFDWEKFWITTVTRRHHTIQTMGYNAASQKEVRPHRPTVYLDQNKWSELARAVLVPERVRTSEEMYAAQEIVRFASDDGVILPLSAAHLLETSGLSGDRRYEVGVTIASFSAGWQMRHPWKVFEQEAIEALARRLPDKYIDTGRPVVTTEPNAWMQDTDTMGLGPRPEANTALFISMLSAAGVMVQELIDPEAEQRESIAVWVSIHERITDQFKTLKLQKDQRRALARRRFWNENIGTYRQALSKVFGTIDFPTFSDKELKKLLREGRMTALLSELFATRFVDQSTKWQSNDLVDMLYLSCAAAYCDYVVAETKTATHLQQIQRRLGMKINVFSNLQTLVEALHADGLTTDTERSSRGETS
ncbi:hypothetical protein [Nocardioides sp. cx-173]|uniref:hypothetical protein n=1 Tax=Nocardioides sp. cx-173 TaxID=2898796 RepID=UPI001E5F7296|nr:hypothetical protein [Nocardioides sp. cx-173]MCD4524712.1 hypothetical protein [Nocardioides sp. cx-173]UGB43222.1 hypothetical protein LQ940_06750 [Nocardioides sp. cx-173]